MRARELGIEIALARPGPPNAITDVAGVRTHGLDGDVLLAALAEVGRS